MFDFDKQIDRRGTNSLKWNKYKDQDVIPLWVADTDFMAPQGVIGRIPNCSVYGT
jgi:cystathionine beta-lyase